jgi:putative PIN family toxin of toxin-antitoxin system
VRVFLDTNVLVSAFATRGLCADVLRTVIAEHDLVAGEVVLEELRRVLLTRLQVSLDRVNQVEELLRSYEVIPRPAAMDPVPVRDAADRWILANARAGSIDVLVTGDADLLSVANGAGARIHSPREFWSELRGRDR